ncbi:glycosyltransferase family 2 protein [Leptospira sp. 2 VSF19]|uniref:Glycosyltransferase family 2 protein n=1 Tax=Leptospira soteropolitanensis TaxID=2950025 RepID=A0AAW5VHH3_9LEPT|nr:glycosyltransferase family 2 protein [Leptospira soteropolitanensis]MCW7493204.1 glycosyltransferase family 2 protein [Leptospira soteropolitanensis]MCW7500727.1 glycosyltransferase family 2 protein [Leptospira soteropolitanensis]MCW7523054.1 glycosyltransferase family 2 protein [Leptospira soteropolitanensis]MCW7526839.1 glycosyltransferase family 2 protein [Leptospira soteropolitanensis]MCW7530772.1 glycosyltransferase family 2 protein [Leptospira soteropolitanensis]
MNRQLKKISIITPFYNEESGADEFFERIVPHLLSLKTNYEIICVNDGSRDKTIEKLVFHHKKNPNIKVVDFSRNFGKEAAVSAGLEYATGDVVIPIDSDLQDPPELIPTLIEKWKDGYDVVTAKRSSRQGESFLKKFTAKHFYRVIRYMSEVEIPVDVGDFRLMDKKVVEALSKMKEKNRFLKGMFAWVGFKQIDVEYERHARFKGSSKWNYWKLWNFALDGILMFSTMPLKIWSYFGFFVSFSAFLYLIYRIIRVIFKGVDVPGYDSTLVIILFLGGIQLIGIGVLGEYIARIFIEVKGRPIYIAKETIGFMEKTSRSSNKRGNSGNKS